MAQVAEQAKRYHVSKDFAGINTKANRTAIGPNEFAWIENIQPIGYANARAVPAQSNALVTQGGETFYACYSANISNTDYVFLFSTTGKAFQVKLSDYTVTTIGSAGTFGTSGATIAQWKNERIVIATPTKGIFTWDGTNLVSIGSIQSIKVTNGGSGYPASTTVTLGAPNQTGGVQATASPTISGGVITGILVNEAGSGYTSAPSVTITGSPGVNASATATVFSQNASSIATYSGRTWLGYQRDLFYSAVETYNDFGTETAGFVVFTDETLHSNITALQSANQYLYVFGVDSINVIGDVRLTTGTPAVTIFTNTNVSASIGTAFPDSIFPYYRSILFMNRYGMFALTGATTTKISDALDGIFPYIDFTLPINGGQGLINNILCAVFQFTYNDPASSPRVIQAVFFEKKWFITSQGTGLVTLCGAPKSGVPTVYIGDATKLYQAYGNTSANVSTTFKSALWPLNDPIRDKEALKFGVEATLTNAATINVTVDSEIGSSPVYSLTNIITWYNNSGVVIPWVNGSSVTIDWLYSGGYALYKSDAEQWGKYLGLTITSTTPGLTYNTLELEHELRARF